MTERRCEGCGRVVGPDRLDEEDYHGSPLCPYCTGEVPDPELVGGGPPPQARLERLKLLGETDWGHHIAVARDPDQPRAKRLASVWWMDCQVGAQPTPLDGFDQAVAELE